MKVKDSSLFALPNFSSLLREGSETGMAATQLAELADQATRLREKLLELGDFDIPAWAQDHISVACAKLDSVFGYFEYGHLNENDAEDEEKVVTTGEVNEDDSFGEPFVLAMISKDKSVEGKLTRVRWTMTSPYRLSFTDKKTKRDIGNIVYASKPAAMKDWMTVQKGGVKTATDLLKKVGRHYMQQFDEATTGSAVKPPSEVDRMRTSQKQEKIALQRRQANELMAAKLRDVQQKSREQQMKATAPKSAAKPATR